MIDISSPEHFSGTTLFKHMHMDKYLFFYRKNDDGYMYVKMAKRAPVTEMYYFRCDYHRDVTLLRKMLSNITPLQIELHFKRVVKLEML